MRVSADDKDPGYELYQRLRSEGKEIRTMLDGVEVKHVETADDAEGWIIKAKLNELGQVYAVGDEVARETLRGKVTFEFKRAEYVASDVVGTGTDTEFLRYCSHKGQTVTCEEFFARKDVSDRLEQIAERLKKLDGAAT